jgi:hypothetical protein
MPGSVHGDKPLESSPVVDLPPRVSVDQPVSFVKPRSSECLVLVPAIILVSGPKIKEPPTKRAETEQLF